MECLTSSSSPFVSTSLVASFSVVTMIFGCGSEAKVVFIRSMSRRVNLWWSEKASFVIVFAKGAMSTSICFGDAMPVRSSTLVLPPTLSSVRSSPQNTGWSLSYTSVVKYRC